LHDHDHRSPDEKDAMLNIPGAGLTLSEQLGLSDKANRVGNIGGIGNNNYTREQDSPFSRLQSQIDVLTSNLRDPRDNTQVFDVKIYRGLTTYQFTERLLARNITEYNSLNRTKTVNLLLTYRINAGTVFFAGYDDHHRQGDQISADVFPTTAYTRTNRAFFTKLQYLFRY